MNPPVLRDIHLPDASLWWPPAAGWWVVLILMVVLALLLPLLGILFQGCQEHKKNNLDV